MPRLSDYNEYIKSDHVAIPFNIDLDALELSGIREWLLCIAGIKYYVLLYITHIKYWILLHITHIKY